MIKYFFTLAISLIMFISEGHTQNAPKEIYKNNYVNEAFGTVVPKKSSSKTNQGGDKSGKNATDDFGFIERDTTIKENTLVPEDLSYESKAGSKIIWLGGIIYGGDSKHMLEKLEELTETAIKHDLMMGPVFLIGNVDIQMATPYLTKIQKRQGLIEYRNEIPKKYEAAKMSPTWIVQTDKGQVLMEATGPLRRNFNKNGELVLEVSQ